jgi:Flp pilus assembly protein TadD
LNDEFGPRAPVRRRRVAAVFLTVIGVLPPLAVFASEAGVPARIRIILSGAKTAVSPPLPLGSEIEVLALAWAVFFGVVAFLSARDTRPGADETDEPEEIEQSELEVVVDQAADEPEPELPPMPKARVTTGPAAVIGDALPVVRNLPEALAHLKKGNELYALGSNEEAIARFDNALKLNPRLAGAWAGKGLASNAMGQYEEAIRCYDESLRLDPRDPAVWHDKGNTLCAIGRLEGALNCFNEALIIDPRDARAWNNKGICLASLGRPEQAVPCCNKATQLDPSYAVAWQAKAMIEERLGHVLEAIAAYKQYIALAPDKNAATVQRIEQHVTVLEAGPQSGV